MAKTSSWWAQPINLCKRIAIKNLLFIILIHSFCFSTQAQKREEKLNELVKPAVFSLTRVMMHDVVSPVIASRYYMLSTIGALAILGQSDKQFVHPSKFVSHFPSTLGKLDKVDPALAALFSIYETGIAILPSGLDIQTSYDAAKTKCKTFGYTDEEINRAATHAQAQAKEIIAYAYNDGYRMLSAIQRYRPKRKEGFWFPTPPAYMDAADPNWRTMRTMVIDSNAQFKCKSPVPFDTAKASPFMNLALEVHNIGNNLTLEQKEIAAFWDCNPFVVATSGHMSLGFKKISPGGHWMNIACIAALQKGISFRKTIQVIALEALVLYDAFIVCWEEKYRSDRVRPETVINKYVDVRWLPLLQTPPFPEYTSGHSVISSASAEVLSFLLGDQLEYVDDTEVIFELEPRKFSSFRQAASEAAISRLYGGIHFRDAIDNGMDQGRRVGEYVVGRLVRVGVKP